MCQCELDENTKLLRYKLEKADNTLIEIYHFLMNIKDRKGLHDLRQKVFNTIEDIRK